MCTVEFLANTWDPKDNHSQHRVLIDNHENEVVSLITLLSGSIFKMVKISSTFLRFLVIGAPLKAVEKT